MRKWNAKWKSNCDLILLQNVCYKKKLFDFLAEDVDADLNLPNLFTSNPREKELLDTVIDKKMRSLSIGKKFSFFWDAKKVTLVANFLIA